MPSNLERACLDIYEETRNFLPIAELCQNDKFTFEILMGPPIHRAPVFFIGYQPGDWKLSALESRQAGFEQSWVVPISQYANADWALAVKLQGILGKDFLRDSVGTNAIFVRSKNVDAYTKDVPLMQRKKIEQFCVEKVHQLVSLIQPQRIIVLGIGTMELFEKRRDGRGRPSQTDVIGPTGAQLTKVGWVKDQEALVVRHLTGARFKKAERETVVARMRDYCGLTAQSKTG